MFAFTTKTKSVTAALAAAAALIAGTPAFAGTFQSNGRTAEVRYGDLDLTQAADRQALNKRLRKAATQVCATSDVREMMACREKALDNVAQPTSAVIARAETKARYADASPTGAQGEAKVVVGN